ncbi:hypothetical protein NW765_003833 [Fusarium oxysporum]|nr:hypothetical protein NW765_003833 [Fusarium oxysporum]
MGRKAAPQPLALSSQTSPQAQAQAQTQSESGAALRSRDDSPTAETVSPGVSPVESKSPRSPRSSPFPQSVFTLEKPRWKAQESVTHDSSISRRNCRGEAIVVNAATTTISTGANTCTTALNCHSIYRME